MWKVRTPRTRTDLAAQVLELVAKRAPSAVEELPAGRRLAATATVGGDELVRFLSEVLPALRDLDDVDVQAPPELLELDCHETQERPSIRFATGESDDRDWYDLAVEVSVGGEQVVFHELFVALAQEREFLLLPSGAFFSLDQPDFRQLRELIAEARDLEDAPTGMLRVGRYQAGLWAGAGRPRRGYRRRGRVAGLVAGDPGAGRSGRRFRPGCGRPFVHTNMRADLAGRAVRPRLGGILADDMGLGKTVQTLALICHAADRAIRTGPFLVVAPASVVSNWAARGAPLRPRPGVARSPRPRARRGALSLDERSPARTSSSPRTHCSGWSTTTTRR